MSSTSHPRRAYVVILHLVSYAETIHRMRNPDVYHGSLSKYRPATSQLQRNHILAPTHDVWHSHDRLLSESILTSRGCLPLRPNHNR